MALADPGEVQTTDEVTSMHGSRVVPLGESVHMKSVGTKSAEPHDGVIERGHSGHYGEGIGDSVDWSEDRAVVEDKQKKGSY